MFGPTTFRRRSQAHSRFDAASARRSVGLGARADRPFCRRDVPEGAKLSQGVAAWLRSSASRADGLEGGFEGWRSAACRWCPKTDKVPARDANGRTLWVTRARPKVDRIACPWLIRRFVDPSARLPLRDAGGGAAVAERFGAAPFDIAGGDWSHRDERCTFDVMVEEFGLATGPLLCSPQSCAAPTPRRLRARTGSGRTAGRLAGLSRMYLDDLAQLDAGMTLYDAFYRWCRDATGETGTPAFGEEARVVRTAGRARLPRACLCPPVDEPRRISGEQRQARPPPLQIHRYHDDLYNDRRCRLSHPPHPSAL